MDMEPSLPNGPAPTVVIVGLACFAAIAMLASIALAVKLYRQGDCHYTDSTDPKTQRIADANSKQQQQQTSDPPSYRLRNIHCCSTLARLPAVFRVTVNKNRETEVDVEHGVRDVAVKE
ncbi:hypothetical protein BJ741DRAFT_650564 [Chytriomyces cf. hyalinus JEL632]|nr:hypothetical protein BJ741DRAFT_650564 [Chytriomyces cf. hyalinus JEL632]